MFDDWRTVLNLPIKDRSEEISGNLLRHDSFFETIWKEISRGREEEVSLGKATVIK